jgi:hypothetical protein
MDGDYTRPKRDNAKAKSDYAQGQQLARRLNAMRHSKRQAKVKPKVTGDAAQGRTVGERLNAMRGRNPSAG